MPVQSYGPLPADDSGLVTLADLKLELGIATGDTSQDNRLQQAITVATVAVRSYTGRNLGAAKATASRDFRYDGKGWLSIPDATAVSSVAIDGTALVADNDYLLWPDRPITYDAPQVYDTIELIPYRGVSPQMGFSRNLDQLWWLLPHIHLYTYTVSVTADWGWNGEAPADAQMAAMDVAAAIVQRSGAGLSSESIDSYSYQVASPTASGLITPRAQDLLAPYKRYD